MTRGTDYDLAIVSSSPSFAPDTDPTSPDAARPGAFGRFADHLLMSELPDLPAERRRLTTAFVCGRARQVPTPLRLGIDALTLGVAVLQRVAGDDRATTFLRSTSLPFVGELARMVRSLGFAYIWETWPDTSPTGAPA